MAIPDNDFYHPLFSPWIGFGDFPTFHRCAVHHAIVSPDGCYMLYSLARQALSLLGMWGIRRRNCSDVSGTRRAHGFCPKTLPPSL